MIVTIDASNETMKTNHNINQLYCFVEFPTVFKLLQSLTIRNLNIPWHLPLLARDGGVSSLYIRYGERSGELSVLLQDRSLHPRREVLQAAQQTYIQSDSSPEPHVPISCQPQPYSGDAGMMGYRYYLLSFGFVYLVFSPPWSAASLVIKISLFSDLCRKLPLSNT